jgi:2-polyprenyl-6-methoxyphenol hydroxylase-like FAD-dependent oxidoreductase
MKGAIEMSQGKSPLQVLVIGAGLGGLCLAQGLRKAGVDVAVYERDAGLATRKQGHRIHIDTRGEQALRECLPPSLYNLFLVTRGQPSRGLAMLSIADGQLQEGVILPFSESGNDGPVTIGSAVDRLTLRQILLAGLEDVVHFNKAFTHYEQQEDGRVRATFTDGTKATGDVLVAADGVGSRVRQQFLPQAQVLDTGLRWLGGKTLLTDEIIKLLPASMHERFATVSGPHPAMMFGCLWFRTSPNQAAAQFWPSLRFQHTEDFLLWGLLGKREQFPIPDEDLQTMDSPDLQQIAAELTNDWYPSLSPLTKLANPEEPFFLTMRRAVPIEPWPSSTITLLGDAIHVMPANGSGANSALRDASQLARSLITVASQGIPLQQALHNYEIEMLRSGFSAAWPFSPETLRRGSGIPFTPDRQLWQGGGQGN